MSLGRFVSAPPLAVVGGLVGAAVVWLRHAPLGVAAGLEPFGSEVTGQHAGLALRAGLLVVVHLASRRLARRRAFWLGVATGALALASLAASAALALFVPVALAVIAGAWAVPSSRSRLPLVATLFVLGLAWAPARGATQLGAPATSGDPRAEVAAFLARGNPMRAHAAAERWAASEREAPGEGHLSLAELTIEIGERERARRILAAIEASPASSEAVKARASAIDARLGGQPDER